MVSNLFGSMRRYGNHPDFSGSWTNSAMCSAMIMCALTLFSKLHKEIDE